MKSKKYFIRKFILLITIYISSLYSEDIKLVAHNGVYSVPVYINKSMNLNLIIDTGATHLTLSNDVFRNLVKNGTISKSDVTGVQKYQIANGNMVENLVVNIRQLNIGKQELYNIQASVSKNEKTPLLLGQNVLQYLKPWQLDYKKNILRIKQSVVKNDTSDFEISYLIKKCSLDDFNACTKLALKYNYNYFDSEAYDANIAIKLFKKACNGNNYKACFMLGLYKDNELDKAIKVKLFKKACAGNYYAACRSLADMYSPSNVYRLKKDVFKADSLYKKACAGGDALSCWSIGAKYKRNQNYLKAKEFLEKGCLGGEDYACVELGELYEKGIVVKQDYHKARVLYERGCVGRAGTGCLGYKKLKKLGY